MTRQNKIHRELVWAEEMTKLIRRYNQSVEVFETENGLIFTDCYIGNQEYLIAMEGNDEV